jgi:hypothetical protein
MPAWRGSHLQSSRLVEHDTVSIHGSAISKHLDSPAVPCVSVAP